MKVALVAFMLGLLFTACSTTREPLVIDTVMRVGMTKQEVRTKFGPPLRMVGKAEGGEDWYYNFGTQSKSPTTFTETSDTGFERSVTYGVSYGKTVSYEEAAVKFSAEGVATTVPPGKVIWPR